MGWGVGNKTDSPNQTILNKDFFSFCNTMYITVKCLTLAGLGAEIIQCRGRQRKGPDQTVSTERLRHVSRRKPCLCASISVQATRGIGQYFNVELKRQKMG